MPWSDSLGLPEGLRNPAPTLTLSMQRTLCGPSRGSGREGLGEPLFLSLIGEGGLETSTSGLLNIYMMLNI